MLVSRISIEGKLIVTIHIFLPRCFSEDKDGKFWMPYQIEPEWIDEGWTFGFGDTFLFALHSDISV